MMRSPLRHALQSAMLVMLGTPIGGCMLGNEVRSFRPAQTPYGAHVTVNVPGRAVRGELLEVRDSALVVLEQQIMLVPFHRVIRIRFSGITVPYAGGAPDASGLAAMRRISRWPGGLTEQQFAALLRAYRQAEAELVR